MARRTRWSTVAASGAVLLALTAGTAAPASAAAPAPAPTAGAAAAPLPGLDPAALKAAIGGLPNADVTGALVRITGSAGHWTGTSGVGDLRTGQGVPRDAYIRIGSISKVFTAAIVLQLAAEHRIDLDKPVQQYLPGVLPAGVPPIEVGQLLNHTSGLPRPAQSADFGDGSPEWFAAHRLKSFTPQQVIDLMEGQPMQFAPGTAQQYSGMNYFVAGLLVEKITGHTFAHEVRSRITRPLGLRHTYVPDADDPRLPGPHSHGYLTVTSPDGTTHPVDVTEQSPWPWAEGGMISTPADLDRFLTELIRGRLLPPARQAELFTVPDVPSFHSSQCRTEADAGRACMSMGLMRVEASNGVVVWGKTGSRPGWTSGVFATRDLSRKIVYSVNPTNLNGTEMGCIQRIAAASFGPLVPAGS
ncbi:serine hydrolase domain-containing protein [Streptomyces sp. Li-HN-5-11]|uniref:serine hydrolase domain-containing protein n=1 Tax=Streptomyces sp. Li-HN-5-11 TaxID=3075432 RepID=UPI0028AC27F2|nr:serine hydrolase domain-containing protein [Streptomyces sp. Li-HN-5-11]WNM29029.1 serine hydrolase domain-containing protein [Streptomyces sp. Li-HN-5-11]